MGRAFLYKAYMVCQDYWILKMTCSRTRFPFFYTRSHLSVLQSCALIFSTNFQFFFTIKYQTTQFSHWIVYCTKYSKNILRFFSKFAYSFVAIELLPFFNKENFRFYFSRELSLFWLNKWYPLSIKESIKKNGN